MVRDWIEAHPDIHEVWPIKAVVDRVRQIYQDGCIDSTEQKDLAALLTAVVGGKAGVIAGRDAPTDLHLDNPPPLIQWTGYVFVFTGQFATVHDATASAKCNAAAAFAKETSPCAPDI